MPVAGWLPVAPLHPAEDSAQHWQRGPPRQRAAITTSEVGPQVLTRAQCST